jgi:hypothetical protein
MNGMATLLNTGSGTFSGYLFFSATSEEDTWEAWVLPNPETHFRGWTKFEEGNTAVDYTLTELKPAISDRTRYTWSGTTTNDVATIYATEA